MKASFMICLLYTSAFGSPSFRVDNQFFLPQEFVGKVDGCIQVIGSDAKFIRIKLNGMLFLQMGSDQMDEAKGDLASRTEWNWGGNIQMPANEMGKKLNLTVTSFCTGG